MAGLEARYNNRGQRIDFRGYRLMTQDERMIYENFPDVFDTLINTSFEYSCLEADYLGIERKGMPFVHLCEIGRKIIIETALEALTQMSPDEENSLIFNPMSEEEMRVSIARKYSSKSKG